MSVQQAQANACVDARVGVVDGAKSPNEVPCLEEMRRVRGVVVGHPKQALEGVPSRRPFVGSRWLCTGSAVRSR